MQLCVMWTHCAVIDACSLLRISCNEAACAERTSHRVCVCVCVCVVCVCVCVCVCVEGNERGTQREGAEKSRRERERDTVSLHGTKRSNGKFTRPLTRTRDGSELLVQRDKLLTREHELGQEVEVVQAHSIHFIVIVGEQPLRHGRAQPHGTAPDKGWILAKIQRDSLAAPDARASASRVGGAVRSSVHDRTGFGRRNTTLGHEMVRCSPMQERSATLLLPRSNALACRAGFG